MNPPIAKLDPRTVLLMVQRKGLTLAAGMALGAVATVQYPGLFDAVSRTVGAVGGAGGGALVLSMLLSWINESKADADIETALMTDPPK